jgi:hypothetical protein
MDRLERQANEVVSVPICLLLTISQKILSYQLAELEAKRDLTQYIVHVDMDAFVRVIFDKFGKT